MTAQYATLREVEEHWTLDDCLTAGEILDAIAHAQWVASQAR